MTAEPALAIGAYALRAVVPADAERLLRWRNAERVRQYMYHTAPIELPAHQAWIQAELKNSTSRHLIFEQDGQPIGYASLTDIDHKHRRCAWGFNLADTPPPKGSGSRMLFCVADYAFDSLGLEKLCSEVLTFNSASLRLHQRLGFLEEGCRRRHIRRTDGVFDVQLLALFADDWRVRRGQLADELFDV